MSLRHVQHLLTCLHFCCPFSWFSKTLPKSHLFHKAVLDYLTLISPSGFCLAFMGTLRTDCPPQPFWHHRRHQWLKNLPANAKRRGFDPWVRKIPWRRAGQPTPVFLPGESHGQRSLAGSQPSSFRFSHHHCCGLNHPDKNGTTILDYPRPSNPAATIQFQ